MSNASPFPTQRFCEILFAAVLALAAALTVMPREAAATGTQADLNRYCGMTYPNSQYEPYYGRGTLEHFCRRPAPGGAYGFTKQVFTDAEACTFQTGSPGSHRHENFVHCDRDVENASYILGNWRITPYPILNPQQCGYVQYSATMQITNKVNRAHYTGTTTFNWDTSRLTPGCNFRAATSGTVQVDVYVNGSKITIQYRNTGGNNYADDNLTLNQNVMSGVDNAGQRITYTKT